ncbi:class III extradiol ring-cleavage dioxygenase [Desulfovibrio sp. UCD-KL4C]|uniref:DODA-type extradiol aromatic ring-opening family dioxygenase n=1 Tax=Desulfovibrio sp. UCD-KL4C TaxID=2578120 RepID=UPI0025C506F5|nr:class III extradiol ring-cleavage dioxygenase [Desulfovibrio sp. UCD-KL4C]
MSTQKYEHTVLYISHGAGPMPILGDGRHEELVENLKLLSAKIKKPSAIIVVSAHWEENVPTITASGNPSLLYDYYGFPEAAYDIAYPAMGHPPLAQSIHEALVAGGIESRLDTERGFDHGMFIPLKIMYPEADIPCVQVSLVKDLAPAIHIALGEALSTIEHENMLILGSGFSFHNMKAFFAPETSETRGWNEAFERWLIETCADKELDEKARIARLLNWESAPHARYCHPREEHLLPLHVCYGAANRSSSECFELEIFGKKGSTYLW